MLTKDYMTYTHVHTHTLLHTLVTCLQDVVCVRLFDVSFLFARPPGLHDAGINVLCRAQLLQVLTIVHKKNLTP